MAKNRPGSGRPTQRDSSVQNKLFTRTGLEITTGNGGFLDDFENSPRVSLGGKTKRAEPRINALKKAFEINPNMQINERTMPAEFIAFVKAQREEEPSKRQNIEKEELEELEALRLQNELAIEASSERQRINDEALAELENARVEFVRARDEIINSEQRQQQIQALAAELDRQQQALDAELIALDTEVDRQQQQALAAELEREKQELDAKIARQRQALDAEIARQQQALARNVALAASTENKKEKRVNLLNDLEKLINKNENLSDEIKDNLSYHVLMLFTKTSDPNGYKAQAEQLLEYRASLPPQTLPQDIYTKITGVATGRTHELTPDEIAFSESQNAAQQIREASEALQDVNSRINNNPELNNKFGQAWGRFKNSLAEPSATADELFNARTPEAPAQVPLSITTALNDIEALELKIQEESKNDIGLSEISLNLLGDVAHLKVRFEEIKAGITNGEYKFFSSDTVDDIGAATTMAANITKLVASLGDSVAGNVATNLGPGASSIYFLLRSVDVVQQQLKKNETEKLENTLLKNILLNRHDRRQRRSIQAAIGAAAGVTVSALAIAGTGGVAAPIIAAGAIAMGVALSGEKIVRYFNQDKLGREKLSSLILNLLNNPSASNVMTQKDKTKIKELFSITQGDNVESQLDKIKKGLETWQ